jgi:hypothetical protein
MMGCYAFAGREDIVTKEGESRLSLVFIIEARFPAYGMNDRSSLHFFNADARPRFWLCNLHAQICTLIRTAE